MKKLGIVIPAYNAQRTIRNTLNSIQIQTISNDVHVYIQNDNPGHTEKDYDLTGYSFPIDFLDCTENVGPGLARQGGLDKVEEPFVTCVDSDDVFFTPIALEKLLNGFISPDVIEVQTAFVSVVRNVPDQNGNIQPMALMPRNDVEHPWMFGRVYSTRFLKENKICFDDLRAMEDSEFNMKIRLLIEGTNYQINILDDISYMWSEGSEHSITRNIWKKRPNIPVYNYGGCSVGAAIAFSRAIEFVSKVNPFNTAIARTAAEVMVDRYFTYYETIENYPEFADVALYVAKFWLEKVFKVYAPNVGADILNNIFMQKLRMQNLRAFPDKTFEQFMTYLEEYTDTLQDVIDTIPSEITETESKSGCTTISQLELLGEYK